MFVALKIFMVENIKIYDTNSFKMYRIGGNNSTLIFVTIT